jgi:putative ABC transport system substrate-binding protein
MRADALMLLLDPLFLSQRARLVELTATSRLPAMYALREDAEAGALMAYGPNFPDMFQRAATYVDKLLKGATPADLPVEQPMKFELVINLKTAQALGLTLSPAYLFRADEVIK